MEAEGSDYDGIVQSLVDEPFELLTPRFPCPQLHLFNDLCLV